MVYPSPFLGKTDQIVLLACIVSGWDQDLAAKDYYQWIGGHEEYN